MLHVPNPNTSVGMAAVIENHTATHSKIFDTPALQATSGNTGIAPLA